MPEMKKKSKKQIKVQDLKPSKDAKGGVMPNVHNVQSHNVQSRSVQSRGVSGAGHQSNLHI
jgi:hypothetical protein